MMLGSVFLDVAVIRHDRTILRDNVGFPTPVPVSGTVDKDTRPRRSRVSLLSLFCISLLCLQ